MDLTAHVRNLWNVIISARRRPSRTICEERVGFTFVVVVLLSRFFLLCGVHCRKTGCIGTVEGRSGRYSLPVPICIDNHRLPTNTVICSHIAIQHVSICKSRYRLRVKVIPLEARVIWGIKAIGVTDEYVPSDYQECPNKCAKLIKRQ